MSGKKLDIKSLSLHNQKKFCFFVHLSGRKWGMFEMFSTLA